MADIMQELRKRISNARNNNGLVLVPSGELNSSINIVKSDLQHIKEIIFEGRVTLHNGAAFNLSEGVGTQVKNLNIAHGSGTRAYAMVQLNLCNGVVFDHFTISGGVSGQNHLFVHRSTNCTFTNGTIISGDGHADDIIGIHVKGLFSEVARTTWINHKRPVQIQQPCENNEIRFVTFNGCYYGIYLSGADYNYVHSCTFMNNMRGVAIQDNANYNRVINNSITDNISTAIHIAYGSSNNKIMYNSIKSDVARGEGILQSYVGSKNNLFANNTINVVGAKYLFYCGAHSDGCSYENNIVRGSASKAVIGIEANWVLNPSDPKARPAEQNGFTEPNAKMSCSVIGNVFFMGENNYMEADVLYKHNRWIT